MRLMKIAILSVLALSCAASAYSQTPNQLSSLHPDAPKDRPGTTENEKKFNEAIKPYVDKARETYPDVKKRFLAGLPPKHVFFVTVRLHDSSGQWEQIFVEVKEITEGKIKGLIANDVKTVTGFKLGDSYTFAESELLDWTISNPDGTEEGNFVGKFLDTYKPN